METIKNKTNGQDNFGSLKKVYFCDMKFLSLFPNIGSNGYFNVQELSDKNEDFADNVKGIEFVKEGSRFTQARENTEQGKLFKQTLTLTVAKDYSERYSSLWGSESRFLVFAYDMNNVGRVIGHIDFDGSQNGAKFFENTDTGNNFSSLNFMAITFYCENKHSAYYCNPAEGDGDDYFNTPRANVLV